MPRYRKLKFQEIKARTRALITSFQPPLASCDMCKQLNMKAQKCKALSAELAMYAIGSFYVWWPFTNS